MCTVSWLRDDARLSLFFNRDEQRTRAKAHPPAVLEYEGRSGYGPQDASAGGTWLTVAPNGLLLCILNYYQAQGSTHPGTRSRGLLPLTLLDTGRPDSLQARLKELPLSDFRAFWLLALHPDHPPRSLAWDEQQLIPIALPDRLGMVTTSSFESEAVCDSRQALFESRVHSEAEQEAFHRLHLPERGPYAPCMHRSDARTVSLTRVQIDADSIRMQYEGDAPCTRAPATSLRWIRSP